MLIHVVQTSGVGCWVNLSHIAAIIEETNGGFTLHFAQRDRWRAEINRT